MKKNLTYIVPSLKVAEKYGVITKEDKKVIRKFMPGNVTLVVRSRNKKFGKEFAFRISSNKFAHKLAKKFRKPIAATSANISAKGAIYDIKEIKKIFSDKADLIIDAGNLKRRKPTTVLDLFDGVNIRRPGIISRKEIKDFYEVSS
jgi:L-threonylcarbamoyladenylate synthase